MTARETSDATPREQTSWDKKIGLIFQHVARLRNRFIDRQVQPHGITSAQVYVVNHLLREDGLTQVELARLLGIGTVAVSAQVDRMEAAGWVAREPDPRDRRSKRVWLRPSAKDKRPVLGAAYSELNKVSLEGLSDQEIETLIALLRRVRDNLRRACGEGEPPAAGPEGDAGGD